MNTIIILFLSYILGSIPTAYLLVKKIKKTDIRKIGSGNVGATNAIRAGGIWIGIITFIIDFLKGAIPVIFVKQYFISDTIFYMLPLTIISVVAGHIFSVFLNFNGGKGVATTAGAIFMVSPLIFLFCILTFAILLVLTRYVSLGSICASIVFSFLIFFMPQFAKYSIISKLLFFILPVIIIYKHKNNIERILKNQENKIF